MISRADGAGLGVNDGRLGSRGGGGGGGVLAPSFSIDCETEPESGGSG